MNRDIVKSLRLALADHQAGRLREAEYGYRLVLARTPKHPDALHLLGVLAHQEGQYQSAVAMIQQAIAVRPQVADYHNNLGNAQKALGQLDAATASFQYALGLRPDAPEIHNNLGNTFRILGRHKEANASFQQALQLRPDYIEAMVNHSVLLQDMKQFLESEACLRNAIALAPGLAESHDNLGLALLGLGRIREAEASFRRAIELGPRLPAPHYNLGNLLQNQGRLREAEASYRRSLELRLDFRTFVNFLFATNYDPDKSAEDIFNVYREFETKLARAHYSTWRPHGNNRDPGRRLKVGYVSPDFRRHSTRHFLEPLLVHHDRSQFEIHAYAELATEDEFTVRYQNHVDHWLNTKGMSDDDLAEQIRRDDIDILVDLAGHTTGNRLLVFMRKPAPVSVSWLGYGYTTGVSAIDYLLTDETSAPVGSEHLFAETPWRLATPGYAYRPADGMGEVGVLPALERRQVTFGTLTRSVRINHRVVRVWSEILKQLPEARLVIDSSNYQTKEMQMTLVEQFALHDISPDRLEIGFRSPPWDVLRGMDIGLDCFPHNSGTTLFESLHMGVPFVTLAGRPSVGRLGSSILEGVGHPEWIARSEDEYVEKVVALATDLPKLAAIRANLRQEMQASPLMDEPGFTRKVEAAYRAMFKRWTERAVG